MDEPSAPISVLDTDLYKLTMQQAVRALFPDKRVKYKFKNRSTGMRFNMKSVERLEAGIESLSKTGLTLEERQWLERKCPFFQSDYLDYLESFRFNPSQVSITFIPTKDDPEIGQIDIEVDGLWVETVLWEVPLMALVSEAYFKCVDTNWESDGQEDLAYQKGLRLFRGGCAVSEFGTRRRREYWAQNRVIEGLIRANKEAQSERQNPTNGSTTGILTGTSNVHLAHLYDLTPVGTIGHEWYMAIAAVTGYPKSNTRASELWERVYPVEDSGVFHIALTDTFSSKAFFDDFFFSEDGRHKQFPQRWKGLRQDSGDPIAFARQAKEAYDEVAVDVAEKIIVFSDSLDVEKSLEINKVAKGLGFKASFGIGTFLTNDFRIKGTDKRSMPLNIVIKLNAIDGQPCVKISDDLDKNTGDTKTVQEVKKTFGLPTS